MFKKKNQSKKTLERESPYLNARREWNERYGDYITSANRWRITAIISISIAFLSVMGVIYFGSQNKLIPYIVEVNHEGKTLDVKMAEQLSGLDERVIRSQLGRFLHLWRTVTTDISLQRQSAFDVYTLLAGGSPAHVALNEWFKANEPFSRAAKKTISVDIRQILKITDETYRVEWVEKSRLRNGKKEPDTHWAATINVVFGEINPKIMLTNPIGMYIKELDFSKDMIAYKD
jgi:type IV secretory pathway TrbF-like protein